MDNQFNSYQDLSNVNSGSDVRSFFNSVFAYMGGALAITGLVAYQFGNTPELMNYLISPTGGMSILGYVIMFAPLGLVLLMSFALNRLSIGVLAGIFFLYATLMGASMSFIFLIYTAASIYKTFLCSSLLFGTMAVLGYTTKQDLSAMGRILSMALIGIVIASLVNFFMKSTMMEYIISLVGVVVFTGLTAYDMQKLKEIAQTEGHAMPKNKLALMGALNLYLDFVNLFLMLLRLFGGRRND
ncbi:MAG: Bax inhibitor-1/YccA family protein [Bacteroidia bacterium]